MSRTFELSLCLSFILFITSAHGDCQVAIEGASPLFERSFGSRKIYKQEKGTFTLKSEEMVNLFCASALKFRDRNHNLLLSDTPLTQVEIKCSSNNKLLYKKPGSIEFRSFSSYYEPYFVSCTEAAQELLYESDSKLPNCDDFITYGIGISIGADNLVSAGICYDLDNLALKYVNFVAYPPKGNFPFLMQNSTQPQTVTLNTMVGNLDKYFSFMSPAKFNETYKKLKMSNGLLNPFEFDLTSLIQDHPLRGHFMGLGSVFNTIWWRSLRLGNWHLFLEALEKRTRFVSYDVFLGSAGNILMPPFECNDNEILTVEDGDITLTAPGYIWAYLKTVDKNKKEEVVVIGYNSPYFVNASSTAFCEDICDEFDWLKDSMFGKVRLLPTMGYVFCCRPEDVKDKIENFPYTEAGGTEIVAELDESANLPTALPPLFKSLEKQVEQSK